jgi:hypothetical protein
MLNREELIDAAAMAIVASGMGYGRGPNRRMAEVVIEAVEPLIRADEREHTAFLHEALLRNQMTYLRAKVEALRADWQQYLDSDPTDREHSRAWSRVDTLNGVLNLIDWSSDD